jgi:hypothetical protein
MIAERIAQDFVEVEKPNLQKFEQSLLDKSQADLFGNPNITQTFEFLLNEYKYKLIQGESLNVPNKEIS